MPSPTASVATECTLTVAIADLQRAIAAVVVHADKQKQGDEQSVLCRVRLAAGKTHLVISASDVRSSGVAWVPILADDRAEKFRPEDGPFVVDLWPKQARQLADMVTPITLDGEATGGARLHLALDSVTVTDVSGKYPDTETTVPTIEQEATTPIPGIDGYPDVPALVGAAFSRAEGRGKTLLPPAGMLGRFEVAAKQFDTPLVVEPVGSPDDTAWLVWLGAGQFAGILNGRQEDDAEKRRRGSRRTSFLARLGLLTAEQLAALQLGAGLDDGLDLAGDDEHED